jgi:mRNA interferase RelE/StbE
VQLIISPRAQRGLDRIPHSIRPRIAKALDALAAGPHPPGSAKLAGVPGLYRIRVGEYRIIYEIVTTRDEIILHAIGLRKDVYRFLKRR